MSSSHGRKDGRKFLGVDFFRKPRGFKPVFRAYYQYWVVGGLALVVLFTFAANKIFTKAQVADFYPSTCLGGWNNPQNAQGQPENFNSSDRSFTEENSSIHSGGISQIFCGNFLPDDFETEGNIQNVGLTLVWQVGEKIEEPHAQVPAEEESVPPQEEPETQTPEEITPQPAPEQTTPPEGTSENQNPPNSPEPVPPPVPESTPPSEPLPPNPEPAPPAPETPPTSFHKEKSFSLFFGMLFPRASAQEGEVAAPPPPAEPPVTEPAPPPAETPSAAPPEQTSETPLPAETASEENTPPPAETTPVSSEEPVPIAAPTENINEENAATSTETPNEENNETSTEAILELPPPVPETPDENFLTIRYSFDGQNWAPLGKINKNNWQNFTVTVPATSWEELKNLQIGIEGIPTSETDIPKVYLDGMLVEAHYDLPPILTQEITIEPEKTGENEFPILPLPDDRRPIPLGGEQSDFKADEAPVFDFDLQGIPTKEAATSSPSSTLPPVPAPKELPTSTPEEAAPSAENPISFFLKLLGFRTFAHAQAGGSGGTNNLPTLQNPIVAEIIGPDGVRADINPALLPVNNQLRISLPEPKRNFKPGRYALKLWILKNGVIYFTENTFTWGVLAVNFNKSVYAAGDTSNVSFGVLTDEGHTVCDADIEMTVSFPSGGTRKFSTRGKTIARNKECAPDNVIQNPDYSAELTVRETGMYQVSVTAITGNGARTLTDQFEVQELPSYDVERIGPTRIYPPATYSMTFKIKANKDFEGEIKEAIPQGFSVVTKEFTDKTFEPVRSGGDTQYVAWQVTLKKGEIKEFGYYFDAPDISPELYKLGPLTLQSTGASAPDFSEIRKWQIAADVAGDVILMWDNTTSGIPEGWTCVSCAVTDPFYQTFIRASSSYGNASRGGPDMVTHTMTQATHTTASVTYTDPSGTANPGPLSTHTHSLFAHASGEGDIRPPFKNLQLIKLNNATTLPNGIIGIFDVSSSSLPANWTYYSNLENSYLRGENTTSTGGAVEHQHSVQTTSNICSANCSANSNSTGGGSTAAGTTHTHTISGNTTFASNTIPYIKVVFAQLTVTTSINVADGLLIALFDATPPSGWNSVSTSGSSYAGRFLLGSDTFGANLPTSTAATHLHATSTITSDAATQTATTKGNATTNTYADTTHTHNFIYTSNSTNSIPVYRDVILAKLQNTAPTVSNAVLNGGASISLIANATKTVTAVASTTDADGVSDIKFATGTIYRSSVSGFSNCAANDLNCYQIASSSCSFTDTTSTVRCSADMHYFANATDASSSFPSDTWLARITVTDGGGKAGSSTSSGVELFSMLAMEVVSTSTNYGTIIPGNNTGSTNQVVIIKNAGNTSSTLKIHGTALTSAGSSITTSSQHYATSTFTFGVGEQELQETATDVPGFIISRPPLTVWGTNTAFPSTIQDEGGTAYNGFLYTTGGTVGGALSTNVYYSRVSATGTLSTWTTTTALPDPLDDHVTVAYNGYLYHIGGILGASATSGVLYAPIQSSGTVGSWLSATKLPTGREEHSGVAYNGYIYVSGGNAPTTATSSVLFAQINSDGTLGSWINTEALPGTLIQHSMVAYNNFLYSTGGTILGSISSTVWFAPINADGSIGSWTVTTAIPVGLNEHSAVVNEGILYLTGGTPTGGGNISTVYFAPLNANGSVGVWSTTDPLPAAFDDHVAVTYNGYLYTLGGAVSAVDTSTVFYAPISSRNVFWGLTTPTGIASATYTGTNYFTETFAP